MISVSAEFDGIDFNRVVKRLKTNFTKSLAIFGKRTSGKGKFGLSRHLQRAGGYPLNSIVWKKGGKGNRKLFYDTGAFRDSPTFEVLVPLPSFFGQVEVGFVHPTTHPNPKSSASMQDIARMLSGDVQWTPTARQRRAFWARIDKSKLGRKFTVTPRATYSNPKRDFITKHLLSIPVIDLFHTFIDRVTAKTLKSLRRKRKIR